jgi:thiamine pyrophosphokinase
MGIVAYNEPVTLIGGAQTGNDEISTAMRLAPRIVAADGGAAQVMSAGYRPERVIGDLDSLPDDLRLSLADVIECVSEQETTDFEKCLMRIDAPRILALGFMGGRIDHQLAVLNVVARYAGRRVVLFGAGDCAVVVPKDGLSLTLPVGDRVALMPMGVSQAWTTGLRWNLDGQALAPDGMISSSNEVAGPITVRVSGPVLLSTSAANLPALWSALG